MEVNVPDSGRYLGQVALVTGGASGIGKAIVRRLVAEGANVVVGDIDEAGLAALQDEFGSAIATMRSDVTVEKEAEALVALAVTQFGCLNAAFNVAGAAKHRLITELDAKAWDYTIAVCLTGVVLGMKHQARQMLAQNTGGAIVNVSSLTSRVPAMAGAAYCASKAGVAMLSEVGALELGEAGIRVNTVSPGLTMTPLTAFLDKIEGAIDAFLERIPLGRPGTPNDIAAAACYLGSRDAAYISGANLVVDGAWATTTYPHMRSFVPTRG